MSSEPVTLATNPRTKGFFKIFHLDAEEMDQQSRAHTVLLEDLCSVSRTQVG